MQSTTPATLNDFLLARIAEREEWARRALDERDGYWWAAHLMTDGGAITVATSPFWRDGEEPYRESAVTQHIESHDPKRVLAECEAKRRIIEEHAELVWVGYGGGGIDKATGKCRTCAENEEADYDGAPMVDLPCPTLRLLALPYADHPDYREEWRA